MLNDGLSEDVEMTLREKEVEEQEEQEEQEEKVIDVIKMEGFIRDVKELAIYLGCFASATSDECVTTVDDYERIVLRIKDNWGRQVGENFICVAGGKGQSNNIFVKSVVVNVFPIHNYLINCCIGFIDSHGIVPYSGRIFEKECYEDARRDILEHYKTQYSPVRSWRDDIKYPEELKWDILRKRLAYQKEDNKIDGDSRYCWVNDIYYNVFWNLYLLALDDKIYETQLNDVVELASYCGFDEPMMRDWCRAVEYVLAGNKLSEDCDFECETVEGLKFFLHREE